MQNIQTINNYSDLIRLSVKSDAPIGVFLESGSHSVLMSEVVDNFWKESSEHFKLIKVSGEVSTAVQKELSILKLPALIILYKGSIRAIFQGLVAKHELVSVFLKLTS